MHLPRLQTCCEFYIKDEFYEQADDDDDDDKECYAPSATVPAGRTAADDGIMPGRGAATGCPATG